MKKRILTLLLAFTLVFSNSAFVLAAEPADEATTVATEDAEVVDVTDDVDTTAVEADDVTPVAEDNVKAARKDLSQQPTEMEGYIPEVSGSLALQKVSDPSSVVVDLRAAEDYAASHIQGTVSMPVCLPASQSYAVTQELKDAFVAYANANISKEKKIYLVCYVGTFCVNYAADWLINDCGFSKDNVIRVLGGVWEDADLGDACRFVDWDYAYNANGIILDVRQDANYNKGYVDKSLHQPIFSEEGSPSTGSDELASAFTEFVKANKDLLASKPVFVLCNAGKTGAQRATTLLKAQGLTNVATIEGGAGSDINTKFVTANAVAGADAVAAVASDNVVIIDVRSAENYANGHLKYSVSMPLFDANGVTNRYDALAKSFLESAEANASFFEGKDLYVLCNSGARGAQAGTHLLMQAGISNANIFTITGGAKDETVKAALTATTVAEPTYNFVSGDDAVKAVNDDSVVIIDVRSADNYGKGHLANSISMPVFDAKGVTNGKDALAKAFDKAVAENADKLAGKKIYLLCNSGARGAQNATKLLIGDGYSNDNIYTIEKGATGIAVRYAFLDTSLNTPVTGADAVAAIGNENVLILDVRADGNYGAGHLKGSLSLPVFTSNGPVATVNDDLAKAFTEYVKANFATFEGKDIYVLCNSGARGAQAATVLLKDAGLNLEKIHTITGGAKDETVSANLKYVSDKRAVNATEESDKLIIDVRSVPTWQAGHLDNSISLPLFEENGSLTDGNGDYSDLECEFLAYVFGHRASLKGKTLYILCNSGSRGAEKAVQLLAKANLTDNVFTIEGGAKNALIQENWLKISSVTLSKTAYTYNGKAQKPSVTVKNNKGQKVTSSNYTVTYASGCKNVGTYTVKVTFKGDFAGTAAISKTFTIAPKGTSLSSVKAATKGFKATWKKQATQTTGYQIQYSTSKSFKSAKTVTVSSTKTTSKSVSKLSAKKTYYVRVRTYKTVGKTKLYSSWSSAKTVKTK